MMLSNAGIHSHDQSFRSRYLFLADLSQGNEALSCF
jgi:hypothetical protein